MEFTVELLCNALQGPWSPACQEGLGSGCACQHLPGGRAQPFGLGKPGRFLPVSQHWAEGDAERQPSGEVKGMGWSQAAWV